MNGMLVVMQVGVRPSVTLPLLYLVVYPLSKRFEKANAQMIAFVFSEDENLYFAVNKIKTVKRIDYNVINKKKKAIYKEDSSDGDSSSRATTEQDVAPSQDAPLPVD
jgi:predicted DNA-binding protein